MLVYLPIAGMAVQGESILLLGVFVGFLSGVFGIGGGFMATPLLIFMGLPPAVAVGTQANQLVASSLTGFLGHMKRGDVDLKMGGVMLAGSTLGSFIGVLLFRFLSHVGQIDFVISLLYVLFLGSMATLMLTESFFSFVRRKDDPGARKSLHQHPFFQMLPCRTQFPRSKIEVSLLVPAGIGFAGGILVSIMGVGGGFFLVPAMIYILGMPALLVAGTSLFQILVTTILATALHAVANGTVDVVLAALLIAGGVVGAQLGVRAARKINGIGARVLMASLMLLVSVYLVGEMFIRPIDLYSTEIR